MKTKKLKGHKRIWIDIEKWKNANLKLDLENLKQRERNYVKIWVRPFSGISLTNIPTTEPKRETKRRIINALFDIYEGWKIQLDPLNEPYYLKVWLYEERFSKSQIVCAIGNSIDFYKTTFNFPEKAKDFKTDYRGNIKNRIESFNWQHTLDEEFLFSTDIGNLEDYENEKTYAEEKKRIINRLKKKHIKITLEDGSECYVFKIGKVWMGEKK